MLHHIERVAMARRLTALICWRKVKGKEQGKGKHISES